MLLAGEADGDNIVSAADPRLSAVDHSDHAAGLAGRSTEECASGTSRCFVGVTGSGGLRLISARAAAGRKDPRCRRDLLVHASSQSTPIA